MSNLLATLVTTASALDTYNQVLETAQNNVANASTPGYARQSMELYSLPFDPNSGSTGGVRSGVLVSSRNQYAEQSVRQQTGLLGQQQQMVGSLSSLQSLFDISGNQGIPKALNEVFQSFSAWATTPGDQATRQIVLQRATEVAQSFQQASNGVLSQAQDTEQQVRQTVDQVNQLVGQLQIYNKQAMAGVRNDAGLDAQVNATLENLSQLVSFSASKQADGTVTVMLNGDKLLLAADQQYSIRYGLAGPDPSSGYPSAPGTARILASDGADVTSESTGGQLGALLKVRNTVIPSLIGGANQAGDLNLMAKQFAERVNQLLTSGSPPQAGVPIFKYDARSDTHVAQSLSVDTSVTPDQLAAASGIPPNTIANEIPLALANLANPLDGADKINGVSFTQFYGSLASRIGGQLNDATNQQQVQQSMVAQAKNLRQQVSGVSLNEEATILVEFQRAYQANSKFITILDQLTQDTINILR